MKKLLISLLLLLAVSTAQPSYYGYQQNQDSVLLGQVTALTFVRGQYTTGRRSSPVVQLQCNGGEAGRESQLMPPSVQCRNVGTDSYGNVQWKCEAELDSSVKFGETVVNCEGYSYPDDPYILKGSCGLEYTLEYTEQGRRNRQNSGQENYFARHQTHHYSSNSFSWGTVFMVVLIGLIAYGLWTQLSANAQRATGGNPPPYPGSGSTYGPGNGPTFGPSYNPGYSSYSDPSCNTYPTYRAPQQNTWRPGFFSGVGTGGILGYMFGRPRTYGYGNTYAQPAPSFSGPSTGFSSGFSQTTSSPRTATAFATTKRR